MDKALLETFKASTDLPAHLALKVPSIGMARLALLALLALVSVQARLALLAHLARLAMALVLALQGRLRQGRHRKGGCRHQHGLLDHRQESASKAGSGT